jgi:hypothetical protein
MIIKIRSHFELLTFYGKDTHTDTCRYIQNLENIELFSVFSRLQVQKKNYRILYILNSKIKILTLNLYYLIRVENN